jgi:hypothetical protein
MPDMGCCATVGGGGAGFNSIFLLFSTWLFYFHLNPPHAINILLLIVLFNDAVI